MTVHGDPPRLEGLPDLLSVMETADVLRIGRGKTYELVREGVVPSIVLGRSIRIPKTALERMLGGGGNAGTL